MGSMTKPGSDWYISDAMLHKTRQLDVLAKELGGSLAQIALAWCLKTPNVSSIIIGASSVDQLNENISALAFKDVLTEEVMAQIEVILALDMSVT